MGVDGEFRSVKNTTCVCAYDITSGSDEFCHNVTVCFSTMSLSLKIEFSGGLELLFGNERKHQLTLPRTVAIDEEKDESTKPIDVSYLIHHLRDHLLKERPELFMENNTV
jgi:hypothetical protein